MLGIDLLIFIMTIVHRFLPYFLPIVGAIAVVAAALIVDVIAIVCLKIDDCIRFVFRCPLGNAEQPIQQPVRQPVQHAPGPPITNRAMLKHFNNRSTVEMTDEEAVTEAAVEANAVTAETSAAISSVAASGDASPDIAAVATSSGAPITSGDASPDDSAVV